MILKATLFANWQSRALLSFIFWYHQYPAQRIEKWQVTSLTGQQGWNMFRKSFNWPPSAQQKVIPFPSGTENITYSTLTHCESYKTGCLLKKQKVTAWISKNVSSQGKQISVTQLVCVQQDANHNGATRVKLTFVPIRKLLYALINNNMPPSLELCYTFGCNMATLHC